MVQVWPAGTVQGWLGLVKSAAAAPVMLDAEMFSDPPPVFVTVMFCVEVVPALTVPKLTLVGDTLTIGAEASVPVPVSGTLWSVVFAALSAKLRLAWRAPRAFGEKVTVTFRLAPGASVSGR